MTRIILNITNLLLNIIFRIQINQIRFRRKGNELVLKYNSSGILVHKLKKEWDESFVLVFPLRKLKESCGYSRHNIEMALGNYLIEQNVPIIDFYSHYIG